MLNRWSDDFGVGIMKVGLFLTNQRHLGTDMMSALQNQIRMVHHARDMGWDSLFSGQHYLNWTTFA